MTLSQGTPIPKPNALAAFVDIKTGALTDHGIQLLSSFREFIVGMNRVTPCVATGTNVITLTPNDAAPVIEGYVDHEIFVAVAANDSTGSVTATVVPRTGALTTIKVYKSNGATQAGAADVQAGELYMFVYNSALDGGLGGLVLK